MKVFSRRSIRAAITCAATLMLGFAASAPAVAQTEAGDNIKLVNPGTLTLCTHLPYKPFEFVNEDREVVGFDVDLAKLLADKMGVDTKIISIGWNQIVSGAVFAANKCDLAMGGATITDKRAKAVLFPTRISARPRSC